MSGIIKRIYTNVSDTTFYGMLKRAKEEGSFIEKDGKVDITALVTDILEHFSRGDYTVIPLKKEVVSEKKISRYDREDAKRIFVDISIPLFESFLARARAEQVFIEENRVNIGSALAFLIKLYASTELFLCRKQEKEKGKNNTGVNYLAIKGGTK